LKVARVELNAEDLSGLMHLIKNFNNEDSYKDIGHLYYVFAQHWDELTNFGDNIEH